MSSQRTDPGIGLVVTALGGLSAILAGLAASAGGDFFDAVAWVGAAAAGVLVAAGALALWRSRTRSPPAPTHNAESKSELGKQPSASHESRPAETDPRQTRAAAIRAFAQAVEQGDADALRNTAKRLLPYLATESPEKLVETAAGISIVQRAPRVEPLQPTAAGDVLQPAAGAEALQGAVPGDVAQPASEAEAVQPAADDVAQPAQESEENASTGRGDLRRAAALLAALMDDPADEVRVAAVRALGEIGLAESAAPLSLALQDAEVDVRRSAAFALARLEGPAPIEALASSLADPDPRVRVAAARALELSHRQVAQGAGDPWGPIVEGVSGTFSPGMTVPVADAAAAALAEELERAAAVHRSAEPAVARALSHVGLAQQLLGRAEDAVEAHRSALVIVRRAYGDDHLDVARVLSNLGEAQFAIGQLEAARQSHEDALAIFERVAGMENQEYAWRLGNLAAVFESLGEPEEAARLYRTAQTISEQLRGPGL